MARTHAAGTDKEEARVCTHLDERGNDGHLVEHLDTRLYEGGPLGVETEAVDEPLSVRTRLVLGLARLQSERA
jgi:hypothetical protein